MGLGIRKNLLLFWERKLLEQIFYLQLIKLRSNDNVVVGKVQKIIQPKFAIDQNENSRILGTSLLSEF